MTDLLNTYTQQHDEFVELLVKYYPTHEAFLERQSPRRTADIRKIYKEMRIALKNMEKAAQDRMQERRVEWNTLHNRLPKEKEE